MMAHGYEASCLPSSVAEEGLNLWLVMWDV